MASNRSTTSADSCRRGCLARPPSLAPQRQEAAHLSVKHYMNVTCPLTGEQGIKKVCNKCISTAVDEHPSAELARDDLEFRMQQHVHDSHNVSWDAVPDLIKARSLWQNWTEARVPASSTRTSGCLARSCSGSRSRSPAVGARSLTANNIREMSNETLTWTFYAAQRELKARGIRL